MTAVTGDLDYVLFGRISAVIAAIVTIAAHRTSASTVRAPVIFIICHLIFSLSSIFCSPPGN
jgi:hypothetical protein